MMTRFDSGTDVLAKIETPTERIVPYGQQQQPVGGADYKAIMRDKLRPKRIGEKMVGWYDIQQLMRTALEVVISTTLGRHSDRREVEALSTSDAGIYDYAVEYQHNKDTIGECQPTKQLRDEIWIDYVSDLGDGWDSTYTVAYYSSKNLKFNPADPQEKPLQRGSLLIMGGDEVYPTASKEEYERRLIEPYAKAVPFVDPDHRPHLFALPGNHDWYDSLTNFSRIFLDNDFFAEKKWRIPQDRSYFALKLPHGWWLVGIDVQLDSDIDGAQIDYLKKIASDDVHGMQDGDNIILCCPEPYWIYAEIYGPPAWNGAGTAPENTYDPKYTTNRLSRDYLEEKIFTVRRQDGTVKKMKIALYLAGDLHHYYHIKNYKKTYGEYVHQITAGGGGAFLHPTHGPFEGRFMPLTEGEEREACKQYQAAEQRVKASNQIPPPSPPPLPTPIFKACFPAPEDSRKLTWLNMLFPLLNRTFGLLTLALYALATWSVLPLIVFSQGDKSRVTTWLQELGLDVGSFLGFWALAFEKSLKVGMGAPVVAFWAVVIFGGFWLFTDTNSKKYKWQGGLAHGLAHVAAAFVISWSAYAVTTQWQYTFSSGAWFGLMGAIALLAVAALRIVRVNWKIGGLVIAGLLLLLSLAAANLQGQPSFWQITYTWGWEFKRVAQLFAAALIICLLSYFIGGLILGCYLWFSLNRKGRHSNEAFSGLGIQDWKNFLRLHIDHEGTLQVYPIGIRRVPRNWRQHSISYTRIDKLSGQESPIQQETYSPFNSDGKFVDPAATMPELLEPEPIRIEAPASQARKQATLKGNVTAPPLAGD